MKGDLSKIEVGAMEKHLATLNGKPFRTDAEQQLQATLTKRLADGVSTSIALTSSQ